ncbi:RNA ligase [Pseudomonas phage vB_PpuM-Voja-6]
MKTVKVMETARSLIKEGSYVDVKIHPDSKLTLAKMLMTLSKYGQDREPDVMPMSELHCTVMYSSSTIDDVAARGVLNPSHKYTAEVTGVDVFGPKEDTLVLLVNCKELTDLHNQLLGIGAAPTFPDYKAHITIQKPYTERFKTKLEKFLKELEEPIEIQLYRERMSALSSAENFAEVAHLMEVAEVPK